mmetsp:Transcript_36709/g.109623  ORF Transcript_36709/g.109623 Transcript_36709/m.109623 type:complete len:353 (+) Transcript_36709:1441-2499(+)
MICRSRRPSLLKRAWRLRMHAAPLWWARQQQQQQPPLLPRQRQQQRKHPTKCGRRSSSSSCNNSTSRARRSSCSWKISRCTWQHHWRGRRSRPTPARCTLRGGHGPGLRSSASRQCSQTMKELGREGRDLQDVSTFSDQGWNASATTLRFRSASVTTSILTAIAGDNKNGNPWREGGRNVVTMREETFMEADRKIVAQAVQQIIAGGTRGYGLHLDRKTGDYILMQEGTVLAVIEFYGSFVTAIKTLKRFLNAFERSHQGEIIKRTPAAPWSFKLVEMEAQELQKFEGGTMNTNSAKGRRSPAKGKGNGKGKSKDKTDMNERGGKGKGGKAWVARTAARARTRARTTSTHRA